MMTTSEEYGYPRRWTATVTLYGTELNMAQSRDGETVDATPSRNDLQRDQLAAAYGEACQYLLAGMGVAAEVQMHKTTKAHGTVRERSHVIFMEDAEKWARKVILAGAR